MKTPSPAFSLTRGLIAVTLTLTSCVGEDAPSVRLVTSPDGDVYEGRILANRDSVMLLEKRDGRIVTLDSKTVETTEKRREVWTPMTADEMAKSLTQSFGGGFAVLQTDHFVICSDASERYTDFCGRLLEKVYAEFTKFVNAGSVKPTTVVRPLPVIVFGRPEALLQYASKQHPEIDFSDTPGYYSVRDNQMLIASLTADRTFRTNSDVLRELRKKPRQVETIVHEAIHQLMFNSGLQVRYADNPIWLSEGIAVYFEQSATRSGLLWSRPGNVSRIHLPGLQTLTKSDSPQLSLQELLMSDSGFHDADQLANSYAMSWALTHYLIRSDRAAFDRILARFQQQEPLVAMGIEGRRQVVTTATGKTIEELERNLIRYVNRLRLR